MNKKRITLAALGCVVCMGLGVLAAPAATLPVQAAAAQEETVMPMSDAISWRYAVINKKLYKRLYNYSTMEWVGSWVFVRDWPYED
ncbi:MAG: hypothetical protein NC517_05330 [Firmicutes bacterium]|nr:hypothetical protein [Bacillota bacterium]